jgi:hypothetical protein
LQTKKNSIISKTNPLDGTQGIVYLLYVGRENYAQNIQGVMTDGFYANRSNVNQTMEKLTGSSKRFLIPKGSRRKKGARGRARDIFTANLTPIMATLKQLNVEYNESKLLDTLTALSDTSAFFPKFLTNMYQIHIIRRWAWYQTLSMYFLFLSIAVESRLIVYPMPEKLKVNQEKVNCLIAKYPTASKDLQSIYKKLASPEHYFNPKFIEWQNKLVDQFSSKESEAIKTLKLLQGIQDLGINYSDLLEQVKVAMEIYKRRELIEAKLLEAEKSLEQLTEKKGN